MVDQTQIGRTTPRTRELLGAFDADPQALRRDPVAVATRYTLARSAHFRQRPLPHLRGNGFEHVEDQFPPTLYLRCPIATAGAPPGDSSRCGSVATRAKRSSIADVLEMTFRSGGVLRR